MICYVKGVTAVANKGRSEKGLFGTIHHYDANGKRTGRSEPGLFGSYTNYDANGKKVGRSDPGMFGSYNHYDNRGRKTGSSDPGMFGSYHHKDAHGKRTGSSDPGMFGSYNHTDNQGCYIATCVYGSYDCPQVWTLRRFRDHSLAKTIAGRFFVRVYYMISPSLVKRFGGTLWFKRIWKSALDILVKKLNKDGVEDTAYNDISWQ